ncbi:hypothetical protein VTJ49DRAFT_1259 [Mycothermus thermophilus]|uniref:60S ribosome biogenesis protein Mak11 n=1 Tax=Humicola insolens TaxID=85995 RepID=A0ABR3VCV6_HUMIN
MAKRKREAVSERDAPESKDKVVKKAKPSTKATKKAKPSTAFKLAAGSSLTIQIVAGSYDRVLHGITAAIKPPPAGDSVKSSEKKQSKDDVLLKAQQVDFADTFLFNAHNSAIRCLALSPPSAPVSGQSQKVILATGSTDERINLYNLSAHPPSTRTAEGQKLLSSLAPRPILENPKNRELGTLLHHEGNITRLVFPNRAKLMSSAEDSTVAVTRVRDWTLLHAFKCPVPKPQNRPTGGDTAVGGRGLSGVNDFAVHPSNKIMISVSKGERCMRLWNLETGKKSRVLNFDRQVLAEVGEGKWSTGEARRIVWGGSRDGEEEFAVGFERDVVVYGMDCVPKCRALGHTRTKVHEIRYVEVDQEREESVLAVATEDGRVVFVSTAKEDLVVPPAAAAKAGDDGNDKKKNNTPTVPAAKPLGQLGGKEAGVTGRVKDFVVLPVEDEDDGQRSFFIVTAGSDGRIRVWHLSASELGAAAGGDKAGAEPKQVGKLLGAYETQNRITCLGAFIMIPRPAGVEESEYEFESEESEDSDSDDE